MLVKIFASAAIILTIAGCASNIGRPIKQDDIAKFYKEYSKQSNTFLCSRLDENRKYAANYHWSRKEIFEQILNNRNENCDLYYQKQQVALAKFKKAYLNKSTNVICEELTKNYSVLKVGVFRSILRERQETCATYLKQKREQERQQAAFRNCVFANMDEYAPSFGATLAHGRNVCKAKMLGKSANKPRQPRQSAQGSSLSGSPFVRTWREIGHTMCEYQNGTVLRLSGGRVCPSSNGITRKTKQDLSVSGSPFIRTWGEIGHTMCKYQNGTVLRLDGGEVCPSYN